MNENCAYQLSAPKKETSASYVQRLLSGLYDEVLGLHGVAVDKLNCVAFTHDNPKAPPEKVGRELPPLFSEYASIIGEIRSMIENVRDVIDRVDL